MDTTHQERGAILYKSAFDLKVERDAAYKAYTETPTDATKKAWEDAEDALSESLTAHNEHIQSPMPPETQAESDIMVREVLNEQTHTRTKELFIQEEPQKASTNTTDPPASTEDEDHG